MNNSNQQPEENIPIAQVWPGKGLSQRWQRQAQPPAVKGQQSVSGHMPDPEADDDVLTSAQRAGLYVGADEEHPRKVGLAEQVEKAEKRRRNS